MMDHCIPDTNCCVAVVSFLRCGDWAGAGLTTTPVWSTQSSPTICSLNALEDLY